MNILRGLRMDAQQAPRIAFVGAGGKTTALFQLAREFESAIVAATTHLGAWQIPLADRRIIARDINDLIHMPSRGVTLVTGEIENDRMKPVNQIVLNRLRDKSKNENIPLLIEADGARQKPLKAPAAHEPPIPDFAEIVVVVAGLGALGRPLDDEHVHRAEIFSQLSGLRIGEVITPEAILRVLTHPQGGLKNIPEPARRIALLNQADTPALQSIGGSMARELLHHFDSVIVGALRQKKLQAIERCAGIILAAGESKRFGSAKQLLDWNGKPFARHVAETALQADLDPIIVVAGFDSARIESALADLPVKVIRNPNYQDGQSASIRAGVNALPKNIGAAIFLLADQPQIPADVIRALVEAHARDMQAILAPLVREERRANPILFDRVTFDDLLKLKGDVGGRAIFDKHRVEYIPWHDELLLFDIDTPEDYERLKNL